MRYLKETKEAFREVYGDKNYFLLTFSIASVLFSLNAVVRNYKILFADFSIKLLLALVGGIFVSFSTGSLIFLTAISILAGIVISFSVFLLFRQISSGVSLGTSGVIMAVLAPACPSCALGVLGVLGLGGLFTFLPFRGLEFGFLSILLLIFSIIYLSEKIVTKVCKI